jgi:aryl-alcohol dehydrogenase-like predicted oxidoreductase
MKTDTLTSYRLLGRSGLRVSPLCLGAMTFGKGPGFEWGADESEARKLFDIYVDRGGNFIDTANIYAAGESERLLGKFTENSRQRLVIASKYSMTFTPDDPNSGGNHRKNMMQTVEHSLKRLGTDYLDILYLHGWDFRTPVEEILRGMDDLVRSGKVLYLGISNTPAWQVARMQAIADLRGLSPFVAFQLQYNLVERTAERDLIPMSKEMGLGVTPWSPLAGGVLSGKYSVSDLSPVGSGDEGSRKALTQTLGMLNDRSLAIVDVLKEVAAEIEKTPAQVALAWTLKNPAVTAPIIGARTARQLEDNLGALDVVLTEGQCERLETVSAFEKGNPHDQLDNPLSDLLILGSHKIASRA